jgi:proline dehydrogenase
LSFFNNLIVSAVELMPKPVVGFFSSRYIAGENIEDAIKVTRELNNQGIYTTIDVLGESIKNREEAAVCLNDALSVLETISTFSLKANISIKPTQMGLAIDEEFAYKQVRTIVQKAEDYNNFVRIDMEDSPYTDATFRLLRKLKQEYENVGVVVQAYLKRTYDDVVVLNKIGTNYRLCKGIYVESSSIAYKDKELIRKNYVKDLEIMLKNGNYVGIATHDEYLIKEAYRLIKEMNIPKDKFEFQMLLGVREDLRNKINNDGYKVRIYVPFGKDWYAYSTRRLKENPAMAGHVMKNLFSFGR